MPITNHENRLKKEKEKIRNHEDLSQENKDVLLSFARDLRVEDEVSEVRTRKLLVHLRQVAVQIDKNLEDATKEDIKKMIEWVQGEDYSDWTENDFKKAVKRFYKWRNGGEYPEKAEWINTTISKNNGTLPEDLLTEEDIQDMMEAAENPRDKALVALLWETGARIGELYDLTIGDFEDRDHGKKIVINGKTGARRLPLVSSIPALNNWLANHPEKDDPEAPLWCKVHGKNAGEQVSYNYLRKTLREMADRADIDKPVNPHHFRHSRATYVASKFTESQMCEWFGWVQGSDRPATYVHMSGRDIDADYDRLHGIKTEEEPEKSKLAPEECPRCGAKNEPEASFCQNCGQALDEEAALEKRRREGMREMVLEKMDEMDAEGSFDDLLEAAVEEKVKEILSEERAES